MKRKILSLIMAISLTTLSFSGCDKLTPQQSKVCPYKDYIVVDVYDTVANFQGIQSGWFAQVIKEKFNMGLNIIAPNKASGGMTLFDVRSASGNIGDLIIYGSENGNFQNVVDEGLVLDMSDLLKDKDIMRYQTAISSLNDKLTQDGIFAIPSDISSKPASESSDGLELTFGPYLRWDVYSKIGYPELNTLEDLLPVLKTMQDAKPATEAGNKTYGFSFAKDWDANMMNAAKQPACFYGYDELGFVLAKADGSDYQSIIDSNSLYMRNIKLYFDANQLGLVDPDSSTQNYDELFTKYQDGSILYSPWPWQCQSAFNTASNKALGRGYMLAPIDDMQIFSYGNNPEGNQKLILSIGSQAKDPERLADFIDWLYSPEGIQISCAQPSEGTAGPEGLTWEMGDDGPYLTEFGQEALNSSNVPMPEGWGIQTWEEGVSQLNYIPVSLNDLDPNGYSYSYTLWKSVLESEATPLDIDWRTQLNTEALSTHQYLEDNNMMIIAPGSGYVIPASSSDIESMRRQCRTEIVDYSWKMVFAQDEATYESLYQDMVKKVNAFGYEQVFAQDLINAKNQTSARQESAAGTNINNK